MGTAAAWAEGVSGSAGVAKEVTRGKRAALQVEEVGEVRVVAATAAAMLAGGDGDGGGGTEEVARVVV